MVLAEIGGAASVVAVFDDTDAIDVETPDDRPARGARRKGGAGNAGLGKEEVAKLGSALAANFLVRHHGDGCKLIGHDRQDALLRRGGDRRWLRLRRRLAIAPGNSACNAGRRLRW